VSGSLRARTAQASQLATKINLASDAVQNALAHYERLLQETGIGIEVWVGVVDRTFAGEDALTAEGERVGWTKIGRDWRIACQSVWVRVDPDDEGAALDDVSVWNVFNSDYDRRDPIDPRPVLNGSRKIRLEALALVPKIVEKLTEEAKNAAASADEAAKVISVDEWAKRKDQREADAGSDDIPF
jgi:hypothetical protein